LRGIIDSQVDGQPVQVTVLKDNRERTIGEKRQLALDVCKTPYITFIDDDDVVSNKYVQLILKELADEPDGVGFRGIISSERSWPVEFVHKAGLTYSDKPIQYQKSFIYTRPLNHLNPVRLEIARQIGYISLNEGEDYDYCKRLDASGLIKKAAFIDEFMYFYQYRGKVKV
jgi:hypothetical protein